MLIVGKQLAFKFIDSYPRVDFNDNCFKAVTLACRLCRSNSMPKSTTKRNSYMFNSKVCSRQSRWLLMSNYYVDCMYPMDMWRPWVGWGGDHIQLTPSLWVYMGPTSIPPPLCPCSSGSLFVELFPLGDRGELEGPGCGFMFRKYALLHHMEVHTYILHFMCDITIYCNHFVH